MASDNEVHAGDAQDMTAHARTYGKVIGLLKWGAVACFIIAFVVIWLISGK